MQEQCSTQEVWKPIPGWEGLYDVSDHGRVRSLDRVIVNGGITRMLRGRLLSTNTKQSGYATAALHKNGNRRSVSVHKLVLTSFAGERPNRSVCRHLNGDKADNRLVNLMWGTPAENERDSAIHGVKAVGTKNGQAVLTWSDVLLARVITASGLASAIEIAAVFGVSQTAILDAVSGKTWPIQNAPLGYLRLSRLIEEIL